jgi:hypothetical protein
MRIAARTAWGLAGALFCIGCGEGSGDDAGSAATPGGKADDALDARTFEVLLTSPHCDVCTSADKTHLQERSEIAARVIELVDAATDSIDVAQFTFSNRDIEAALVRAHERGVKVRLAMDAAQKNGDTVSTRLQSAGLQVEFVQGKASGSNTGLQHAKYMIVDGDELLMGSNNWSSTGMSINEENTIVLRSLPGDPMIAAFQCDFQAAFGKKPDEAAACSTDEVKFTPSSAPVKMIRDELRLATTSVDVLMHHLVFGDLLDELSKAAERGVQVRVVVNAADRAEISGSKWNRFFAAGGQVRFKQTNAELFQIMHHKLVVIDGRLAVIGSGNWSGSAFFNNYEFYVRWQEPEVVRPFGELFARLWDWSLTAASLDAGLTAAEQDFAATQVFFGNLHAHFEVKDGDRLLDDGKLEREVDGEIVDVSGEVQDGDTARHAFEYARDEGGLDFIALSPHVTDDRVNDPADQANMTEEGFQRLVATAAAVTAESGGTFVALAGSEWSTSSSGNHVNVLATALPPKSERGRFDRLYEDYLPGRALEGEQPILMWNHPRTFRRQDESLNGEWDQIFGVSLLDIPKAGERTKKFNDYGIDDYAPLSEVRASWIDGSAMPDEAVVTETLENVRIATAPYLRLIEVTVGRGNEFASEVPQNPSHTPLEDGTIERFVKVDDWQYYLAHGYQLAPVASHDNHFANWGTGHTSRTAVIAPKLDEASLHAALRNRAVYASEDENLELRVYADDRVRAGQRHATLEDAIALQLRVSDPDFAGPFSVSVFVGTVGAPVVSAVVEEELAADAWQEISVPLPSAGDHFVFVRVHEVAPDRMAWSAPIFVQRR